MIEEFLHYIWKYRLAYYPEYDHIEVFHPGFHNTDSGPDFFNARIKIDETLWSGNVEIHIFSSDWNKHGHQHDKAYDNVILHVVYQHDEEVRNSNGIIIPVLELKGKFDENMYVRYKYMLSNNDRIPCEKMIKDIDMKKVSSWLDRMMTERLEKKSASIRQLLVKNGNNAEETFYQLMARSFGSRINALPFELMAKSLPLQYLAKHKSNLLQIEALIFGQAGMLDNNFSDEYPLKLKREYQYLRKKLSLVPVDPAIWKFLRLRPYNFPTIRLAQFAMLVYNSSALLSKLIDAAEPHDIYRLLTVSASSYWDDHFLFDKSAKRIVKKLSSDAVNLIIINALVPFMFVYGRHLARPEISEKALALLENVPGEKNTVTELWNKLGFITENAFTTQALLELKTSYCDLKKCLNCSIGNMILNT
jgi:hypothetical protein